MTETTLTKVEAGAPPAAVLNPLTLDQRFALADMFTEYCDAVDGGEFERWPDFFVDDCAYRVTSRENYMAGLQHGEVYCEGIGMLRDRVDALRDSTVYEPRAMRHIVSCCKAGLDAEGRMQVRTNFLVIESLSDDEPQIYMAGEYHDTVVQQGGALRFQKRICVYDNYRIRNSLIYPV